MAGVAVTIATAAIFVRNFVRVMTHSFIKLLGLLLRERHKNGSIAGMLPVWPMRSVACACVRTLRSLWDCQSSHPIAKPQSRSAK
jgi:hypothetical protein